MWQAVRDREEKLVGRQVENGIKNEFSLQCARVYVCECVCGLECAHGWIYCVVFVTSVNVAVRSL